MPLTKSAIRTLMISYISAVVLILFLLIASQGLIQYSLYRGQVERVEAAQINAQVVLTQRMLRNVIFLQNPAPNTDYVAYTKAVETQDITWEQTQKDIDATGLFHGQAHYSEMQTALHRILLLEHATEKPAPPDKVRPDVGIFFLHENAYIDALIATYAGLTQQADNRVSLVRVLEIVLFTLTVMVIIGEVLLVVRPATRQMNEAVRMLGEQMQLQEEQLKKFQQKGGS